MTILLYILLVLAIAIGGLLLYASTKPDDFAYTRSATISAPAERIFPLIADFHQWRAWSPYENKDPQMTRTLSGAPSGVGAIYEWSGDKNVGQGRMEIVESTPPSRVLIKLDFFKPFKANNMAEFTITPSSGGSRVVWTMRGRANLMSKVMGVIMDLDKMIGKDFEIGLANLKRIAEG